MQQRRLRLGDILDDYCPRERRITNHAVVAMIEDEIRLTRCTTCDTEHDYKQAKAPVLRRKKDSTAAAYKEVLAEVTGDLPAIVARPERPPERPQLPFAADEAEGGADSGAESLAAQASAEPQSASEPDDGQPLGQPDAARVHRRLIRATLPRIESQVTPRPIPEFTMHQPQGRPGKFRGGQGRGNQGRGGQRQGAQGRGTGHANGNVAPRSPFSRGGQQHGGRHEGPRQGRRGKKK